MNWNEILQWAALVANFVLLQVLHLTTPTISPKRRRRS